VTLDYCLPPPMKTDSAPSFVGQVKEDSNHFLKRNDPVADRFCASKETGELSLMTLNDDPLVGSAAERSTQVPMKPGEDLRAFVQATECLIHSPMTYRVQQRMDVSQPLH
jgi:hypothetical protein